MKNCRRVLACVSLCAAGLVPACGGVSKSPGAAGDNDGAGASAGTGGSATRPSMDSCEPTGDGNTSIVPDSTGWVDHADACNDVGVQGTWFAYGDQYENGNRIPTCIVDGDHDPSECAQVTTPDPTVMSFPNVNGLLETTGTAELVIACVAGSLASSLPTSGCPAGMAGGFDFYNMWGAGIGFDFNANPSPPRGNGKPNTWDASAYGVVGIKFTIKGAPQALRVEFPMLLTAEEAAADYPPVTTESPTTDTYSVGPPYWGARPDSTFPASPVKDGDNVITWDRVSVPRAHSYVFDTKRILGIRFHVPTSTAGSLAYHFTISNLTFLRQLPQ